MPTKTIIHSIKVIVEAPYGRTWHQEIEVKDNNVGKAIDNYKKVLGKGYRICDWYKCNYEEVEVAEPKPVNETKSAEEEVHYHQMSIFDDFGEYN